MLSLVLILFSSLAYSLPIEVDTGLDLIDAGSDTFLRGVNFTTNQSFVISGLFIDTDFPISSFNLIGYVYNSTGNQILTQENFTGKTANKIDGVNIKIKID